MRDYEVLIKQLRECGSRRDCLDCPYDNDASYCIEPRITEAADAIEELLAQKQSSDERGEYWQEKYLHEVPQWVSVEDEKNRPACGERVNLTDGIAVFEGFLSISGKWMISFGEFAATHWMPLPAPPKEE